VTLWRLGDLDVFFLSYDETAADRHFAQLQSVSPRPPKRVHGIKGLQNAYCRAARTSLTERFITVDADSFVDDDTVFRVTADDEGVDNLVFAFMALNPVNGLVYGNGSIKCWAKRAFDGLRTHEHTPAGGGHVDFYHALPYRWLPETGSINCFATDPFHAFRGGYREAVKLSIRPDSAPAAERRPLILSDRARHRISTWVSVGRDADHGEWAIYGARRGLIDYWLDQSLQLDSLSDFDYFVGLWGDVEKQGRNCDDLIAGTSAGMIRLGLPGKCLEADESVAVKAAGRSDR
jgi:hypothetical protein